MKMAIAPTCAPNDEVRVLHQACQIADAQHRMIEKRNILSDFEMNLDTNHRGAAIMRLVTPWHAITLA